MGIRRLDGCTQIRGFGLDVSHGLAQIDTDENLIYKYGELNAFEKNSTQMPSAYTGWTVYADKGFLVRCFSQISTDGHR